MSEYDIDLVRWNEHQAALLALAESGETPAAEVEEVTFSAADVLGDAP
jgi:hypothetical protein